MHPADCLPTPRRAPAVLVCADIPAGLDAALHMTGAVKTGNAARDERHDTQIIHMLARLPSTRFFVACEPPMLRYPCWL
jgi:hypothetical protein